MEYDYHGQAVSAGGESLVPAHCTISPETGHKDGNITGGEKGEGDKGHSN